MRKIFLGVSLEFSDPVNAPKDSFNPSTSFSSPSSLFSSMTLCKSILVAYLAPFVKSRKVQRPFPSHPIPSPPITSSSLLFLFSPFIFFLLPVARSSIECEARHILSDNKRVCCVFGSIGKMAHRCTLDNNPIGLLMNHG